MGGLTGQRPLKSHPEDGHFLLKRMESRRGGSGRQGDLTQEPLRMPGGSSGCCYDYYKGTLVSVFMTGTLVSTMAGRAIHSPAKQTASAFPHSPGDLVTKSC